MLQVVCLVDSKHVHQHLTDDSSECSRQIAFADRVLLNKIDLVSEAELLDVEASCMSINSTAKITSKRLVWSVAAHCCKGCQNSEVPISELLSMHAFDPEQAAACIGELAINPKHSDAFMTVSRCGLILNSSDWCVCSR